MTDPRVAELGRREALLARMRNVARDVTGDEPVRPRWLIEPPGWMVSLMPMSAHP